MGQSQCSLYTRLCHTTDVVSSVEWRRIENTSLWMSTSVCQQKGKAGKRIRWMSICTAPIMDDRVPKRGHSVVQALLHMGYFVKLAGTYKQRLFNCFLCLKQLMLATWVTWCHFELCNNWVGLTSCTRYRPNPRHRPLWEPYLINNERINKIKNIKRLWLDSKLLLQ